MTLWETAFHIIMNERVLNGAAQAAAAATAPTTMTTVFVIAFRCAFELSVF